MSLSSSTTLFYPFLSRWLQVHQFSFPEHIIFFSWTQPIITATCSSDSLFSFCIILFYPNNTIFGGLPIILPFSEVLKAAHINKDTVGPFKALTKLSRGHFIYPKNSFKVKIQYSLCEKFWELTAISTTATHAKSSSMGFPGFQSSKYIFTPVKEENTVRINFLMAKYW